jgi:hypothetical protein
MAWFALRLLLHAQFVSGHPQPGHIRPVPVE